VLAIAIVLCPVASAASDGMGAPSLGARMVQSGIDFFFKGVADDIYEVGYRPPGHNVSINGTSSEIYIYELNTMTVDPYKYDSVTAFRRKTLIFVVIYVLIVSALGMLYVVVSRLGGGDALDGILNRSSTMRTQRIKEYFENLAISIAVIAWADIYIIAVLSANFLITSFLMVGLLTSTTIATSADNGYLYLAMAIAWICEYGFMIARLILIFAFVAAGRLIGALLISNKTRSFGLSIVYYLTGIVFLQSLIVFLTTIGYISIDAMKTAGKLMPGEPAEGFMYVVLILILMVASVGVLFGLVKVKPAVMTAVKLVI